jgi:formiminotetrahydrofolate cyclodeaminase
MSESDPNRLLDEIAAATAALAEGDSEPVSGAVAAAVAALAASLAAATADRSRNEWDEAPGIRAQAQALRRRTLALGHGDAAALAHARAVLAERRSGNATGTLDTEIGDAVLSAAEVPLQIGASAADVAQLAALTASHATADLRADATVAAILAAAAAEAAAHLVAINLIASGDEQLVALARGHAEIAAKAAGAAIQEG